MKFIQIDGNSINIKAIESISEVKVQKEYDAHFKFVRNGKFYFTCRTVSGVDYPLVYSSKEEAEEQRYTFLKGLK